MRKLFIIFVFAMLSMAFINDTKNVVDISWYGPGFNGRITANGEIYDQDGISAASPDLPFGTKVLITTLDDTKSIIVRINDRGPYKMDPNGKLLIPLQPHPKRKFDLSKGAFQRIANLKKGIVRVKFQILE